MRHCPDPILKFEASNALNSKVFVKVREGAQRKVFLLSGVLGERKGLTFTLDALLSLPESVLTSVTLALAGPIVKNKDLDFVNQKSIKLQEMGCRVVIENRFIDEREMSCWIDASDVVLIPYQNHIGMSAILVRATLAGKQIIGTDFGLIGELIKKYKLGSTYNGSFSQLAREIRIIIQSPESDAHGSVASSSCNKLNAFKNYSSRCFYKTLTCNNLSVR